MKKFLTKLSLFSLPAVFFFLTTLFFYNFSKKQSFASNKRTEIIDYLLMGDSQMQRLNPSLIAKNSKNIASSGEHYYFSYQKLRTLLLSKNQKIKTILLGVSIHNFAPIYNRMFDINQPEGQKSLEQYLYFIDPSDDSEFLKSKKHLIKPSTVKEVYDKPNWGGFKGSDYSNPEISVIIKTFNMHFNIKTNENKFCFSQQKYLYRIDSLCKINHIKLIMVSTPYHPSYYKKIDAIYFRFFEKTIDKMKHRLHFNFLNDKIDPSMMSDANHLNTIGATHYSKEIQKRLAENLKESSSK